MSWIADLFVGWFVVFDTSKFSKWFGYLYFGLYAFCCLLMAWFYKEISSRFGMDWTTHEGLAVLLTMVFTYNAMMFYYLVLLLRKTQEHVRKLEYEMVLLDIEKA